MTESTYNAMIAELQQDKQALLATITKSKEIIHEHEQILKTTESELAELDNGMQFLRKRYLRENPEAVEEISQESQPAPTLLPIAEDSNLDIAVLAVIDNKVGTKMTAREVTEILVQNNYPTNAKDFMSVVGNTLRILAKDGKIGFEKTGKFVKYYSRKRVTLQR